MTMKKEKKNEDGKSFASDSDQVSVTVVTKPIAL